MSNGIGWLAEYEYCQSMQAAELHRKRSYSVDSTASTRAGEKQCFRRMSETPTTTTSQKSIEIDLQFLLQLRLQFVSQYFRCPYALRKGKYCQYSFHLYRSTPGDLYCKAPPQKLYRSTFENLGGSGHRDVPQCCTNDISSNRKLK